MVKLIGIKNGNNHTKKWRNIMFLTETVTDRLPILDAGIIALLGYAVVFFGLILLLGVVAAMGRYFVAQGNKAKKAPAKSKAAPAPAAPVQEAPTAPGTAGKLKLYDTPPKTAAMLMAIVANKMGKPINELRFISIREVKE